MYHRYFTYVLIMDGPYYGLYRYFTYVLIMDGPYYGLYIKLFIEYIIVISFIFFYYYIF